MAEALQTLQRRRRALKVHFKKALDKCEEILERNSDEVFQVQLELAKHRFKLIEETSMDLQGQLSDESLEEDIEDIEDLREQLMNCEAKAKISERMASEEANINILSSQDSLSMKLPKLVLRKFSGNYEEWPSWFDSYKSAIHYNSKVSDVEKFTYLKSLLEGTALRSIEGLSITDRNYIEAIDILQTRFGRPEILIRSHMRKLIACSEVKDIANISGIRGLYEEFEIRTRSLKNLGIQIDSYGALLAPLLESKLPKELLLDISRKTGREDMMMSLEEMLQHLSSEVSRRERIEFDPLTTINEKRAASHIKTNYGTTAALHVFNKKTQKEKCIFCEDQHASFKCPKAAKMTLEERKKMVTSQNACFNCLQIGHKSMKCHLRIRCNICKKWHQTLLCMGTEDHNKEKELTQCNTRNVIGKQARNGILQVAFAKVKGTNEEEQHIKVLFDAGSQSSFIVSSLARKINAKVVKKTDLKISGMGGHIQMKGNTRQVELNVKSMNGKDTMIISAYEVDQLCSPIDIEVTQFCLKELKEKGIHIDPNVIKRSQEISLLIGADYYWEFVSGKIERSQEGPVAIESKLGWMLHGSCHSNTNTVRSLFLKSEETLSIDDHLQNFWRLESLGIKDKGEELKCSDYTHIIQNFEENIKFKNGSYEVNLPWKDETRPPSNYHLAQKRLQNSLKGLRKNKELLEEYNDTILKYVEQGFAEEVADTTKTHDVHYLSHHAVIKKERETTRMRIVFDGSAKEKNKLSLNDCLEAGPSLTADILSLLMRFRFGKIALVADIKQAFLKIRLYKEDRDYVRYLWVDKHNLHQEGSKIKTYRMISVLFGLTSSPFLLAATLQHHIRKYANQHPNTVKQLLENFYVDDFLSSVDDREVAKETFTEAYSILQEANMQLRKWQSNDEQVRQFMFEQLTKKGEDIENCEKLFIHSTEYKSSKVLGLIWNEKQDVFSFEGHSCKNEELSETKLWTKRIILQVASTIFDPLGVLAPFIVRAKIILQGLWEDGVEWDSPISHSLKSDWEKWINELKDLKDIRFPRHVFSDLCGIKQTFQLHIFCDASEKAYATCAYIRGTFGSEISSHLLSSKSRVAPLKKLSIPRLELMSALIAVRLGEMIKTALHIETVECHYWIDSMVALHWIKGSARRWKPFVCNRVEEIQSKSNPAQWNHCPGTENPADLPSRGNSVKELVDSTLWWKGPGWLCQNKENWPSPMKNNGEKTEENDIKQDLEIRSTCSYLNKNEQIIPIIDINKYSSYERLIRVTAWIMRILKKWRNKEIICETYLTAEELERARLYWVENAQNQAYSQEKNLLAKGKEVMNESELKTLDVFCDTKNFIRLRGRLQNAGLEYDQCHPLLIPTHSKLAELIIMDTHKRLIHAGVKDVVIQIREHFWIPKIRQIVKFVLHRCLSCKKLNAKKYQEIIAPLPQERCTFKAPFDVVGVDFAGPVFIFERNELSKSYICLFTCSSIRAIHLELVSKMNTEAFLLAFKRFVNRRGLPSMIVSDNAKTFKSSYKDLKDVWVILNDENFQDYFAYNGIKWKFIVDRAPWWGGFWERLVRSVKTPLRKLLPNAKLNREEFQTILCEVEAMVNSRPITYVYNETTEPQPLCPSFFLCGKRLTSIPSINQNDEIPNSNHEELTKRIRYVERLSENLWVRWKKEYLPELNAHSKKIRKNERKIKEGEVVLIESELPRHRWKMGVVVNIYVGKDDRARSALVKTSKGSLKRPIQKLYPLEITSDVDKGIARKFYSGEC